MKYFLRIFWRECRIKVQKDVPAQDASPNEEMLDPGEVGDDESNLTVNGPDHARVCYGSKVCDICYLSLFFESIWRECIQVYHEDE